MIWPDPTHQPTHPPTHQTIHPPMGGEVFTNFKSSNGIEISQLVQVLLNFDWFQGSPPGGWGVDGCGWELVRGSPPHTCTCMCMHGCMHVCVWHNREFPGIPPWGRPFALSCLPCACVCVSTCMCTCVGHPHSHPPNPHPPPPELQGAQNTKIQ